MKKCFVRILLAFLVSAMFSLPLFSADAKVTYVKGKVEVSHNGGEWILLKTGDTVSQSDVINTGFQSEARINMNGSIMAVPALTRVTLETLSTSGSKDTVSLYVNTGAVRSKVTHTENKKIDYTARTAVAVASVRGTDFTITAIGAVSCLEGAVAVFSAKNFIPPVVNDDSSGEEKSEDSEKEGDSGIADADGASGNADTDSGSDAGTTKAPETTGAGADNNGPATAATPAKDISSNSGDGAVVVGAGQSTTFTGTGNPNKPTSTTADKTDKVKNTVTTQAQKEAAIIGGSKTNNDGTKSTKGTVVVNITLEE